MSSAQLHTARSGLRDVLPSEFREVHAISETLRGVFANHSYQELRTPALEEPDIVERGPAGGLAYRVVDEHGHALALRADMTVPIARLVTARYGEVEEPLRFSYIAPVYKAIHPQKAQAREVLQAGIELIGVEAPRGIVEVLTVLDEAFSALGCHKHRIGFNDAGFVANMLGTLDIDRKRKARVAAALATTDFVSLKDDLYGIEGGRMVVDLLCTRVSANQLDSLKTSLPENLLTAFQHNSLGDIVEALPQTVQERIMIDFSLTRNLGYYSGPVFEIYAPNIGTALGGGGHYDDLLGYFGHSMPAVGFALDVDLLHKIVKSGDTK